MLNDPNFQKRFKKSDIIGDKCSDSFYNLNVDSKNLPHDIRDQIQQKKSVNNDIVPLIAITVLGKRYLALLDSGATWTCAGMEMYDDAKSHSYFQENKPDRRFATAGGVKPAKAMFSLPLKLDAAYQPKMQQFYIIEGLPIILLGRDFIRKHNISFSLLPGDAHWNFRGKKHSFVGYKTKVSENDAFYLEKENKVKLVNSIDLTKLTPERRDQMYKILMSNKELFSDMPGRSSAFEFEINFKEGAEKEFVKSRPYTANPQKRAIIDQLMDEAILNDFIEPADNFNCPIAVPTVLAPKPNGKFRMCQDYKRTNKLTTRDSYCLPTLPSIFQKLEKAKFFTVMDITKGFHQIVVKKSDRWKTAFINHRGVFQYKVMPFGLKNGPAAYQRLMDNILSELRWDYCLCYMDDVIVFSETWDLHLEHVNTVLKCLLDAGLTVNPDKMQTGAELIKYLGMIFTPGIMQPNPDKVKAIREYPQPRNKIELQRFIGMLGFFIIYIYFATIFLDPLHKLISKGSDWVWTQKHTEHFNAVKNAIADNAKLYLPDMNRPFTIRTDACDIGISAVLMQEDEKNVMRAVSFASRTLNKSERNYSTAHKECLAVIYGVKKYRMYIEYSPFVVETDHQALKWLMSQKEPTGRLARWALELQEYDIEIKYRKGSENQLADALSRAPVDPPDEEVTVLPPMTLRELKYKQLTSSLAYMTPEKLTELGPFPDLEINALIISQGLDKELKGVINFLNSDGKFQKGLTMKEQARIKTWAEDSMLFDNGLLVKYIPSAKPEFDSFESNFKIVVPSSLRLLICKLYHDHPVAGGHKGIAETTRKIQEKYTWMRMQKFIRQFVQTCDICQKANPANRKKTGFLVPNRPMYPWEIIAVDFIGPLPRSNNGFSYILVFVDLLTKWVEIYALRSANENCLTDKLFEICCRYGFPRKVICDNGTQFTSFLFEDVCKSFNIDIKFVPAYHAQANPAERVNRNIKFYLRKYTKIHKEWDQHLHAMAYQLRTSLIGTTGFTPAELMFGRKLNDPFAVQLSSERHTRSATNLDRKELYNANLNNFSQYIQQARDNLQVSREAYRSQYDHYRREKVFKIGDLVTYRVHPVSKKISGLSAGLMMDRDGPYRITSVDGQNIYRISDVHTGALITKAHVSQLTPYVPRDSQALSKPAKARRKKRVM